MNDDLWMNGFGKGQFSHNERMKERKNERMIEWLNVLELFLMLSIELIDYKLYASKSILVEILI